MSWFRRARREQEERPKVMQIPVGYDRIAAQVAEARCEAAGLRVRLLTMDASGNLFGITALQEHVLLVREDQLVEVKEVLKHLGAH